MNQLPLLLLVPQINCELKTSMASLYGITVRIPNVSRNIILAKTFNNSQHQVI
jgi:hypothetical protein